MADHAVAIRDALRAVANELVSDTRASDRIQTLAAVATTQGDILTTLQDTGRLLIEVEGAADFLEALSKRLRAAMLDAMVEAGAPGIDVGSHIIDTRNGVASAMLTGKVPPEFMRHPEPAPDMMAIAKALRAGQNVEGAVLRNPQPSLVIKGKKQ